MDSQQSDTYRGLSDDRFRQQLLELWLTLILDQPGHSLSPRE